MSVRGPGRTPSSPTGRRESYRHTVTGFLAFCRRRQAHATVALAREYVELARLERAPSAGRRQSLAHQQCSGDPDGLA